MKKVLITGASGGIGRALSKKFSENGYKVFAGFNKNRYQFQDENIFELPLDVTSIFSVKEALKVTGGIDILINNSGISQQKLFQDISEDDWDNMFNVNIKGMFLLTKEVVPYMINKKYGRIINISSIWGETGASMEVHYSASKAAVIGFTKALAKELAPSGITVNCISPGMIKTDMNNHLSQSEIMDIVEDIPLKRQGMPEDVADTALFLASDADYLTGQNISVSGGWNL